MLYTDKCMITPITKDQQFGGETPGTAFESICRVEMEDVVRRGTDGNFKTYSCLIILPPGTDIEEDYRLRITEQRRVAVTDPERHVAKAFNVGGARPHHIEVYTK